MNFIEKLQNKPHYVRTQILWISVILAMFLIISLWLVYLDRFLDSIESEQKPEVQEQKQSIPSIFSTIKEDLLLLKENLQAGFEQIINNEDDGEPKFEVEILNP